MVRRRSDSHPNGCAVCKQDRLGGGGRHKPCSLSSAALASISSAVRMPFLYQQYLQRRRPFFVVRQGLVLLQRQTLNRPPHLIRGADSLPAQHLMHRVNPPLPQSLYSCSERSIGVSSGQPPRSCTPGMMLNSPSPHISATSTARMNSTAGEGLDVLNQAFQHQQPAGAPDVLRVHGQVEASAVPIDSPKLCGPAVKNLVGVPHRPQPVR